MEKEEAQTVMSAFRMMQDFAAGEELTPLKITVIDSAYQILNSYVGDGYIIQSTEDAQGILTMRGTTEMFLESEIDE